MKTKETFYSELETKANDFFNSLLSKCDISINDYIYTKDIIDIDNLENFDGSKAFDAITDIMQDNNAFNLDVIYYSNAVDYLKENDPSLNESLALATDHGFNIENLNSEVLASLLYSQNETENYYSLENDITAFFDEIENDISNFFE